MHRIDSSIDLPQITSILRAIAGQLDFRAVIGAVSTEIVAKLPHDHLDVAIMSGDRELVSAYETGLHTEWDALTTATKAVDVSPIRDLFRGRVDFILTDDAQLDPRFHFAGAFSNPIFAANLRSRLHVPLQVEGKVIGALSFSTQQMATYRPSDVQFARAVADILSPYFFALQQSELARQSEMQQVEAEARAEGLRIGALHLTEELENARQAIGMDLHDQTLADLSRMSRTLKRLVTKSSVRGAAMRPLLDDMEHCVLELRVIVDNAKPSVLQFFGFGQAIEALLERCVGGAARLDYRLHDNGSSGFDRLPPNVVVSLYRIVQEAINNIVRHASASKVEIWLTSCDGSARIIIEDDGVGFSSAPPRRGGGLANMRTRASLIEASLTMAVGSLGTGTKLEISLSTGAVAMAQA